MLLLCMTSQHSAYDTTVALQTTCVSLQWHQLYVIASIALASHHPCNAVMQEDAKIIQLVGQLGAKRWSMIAKELPGRIGKQCRERCLLLLNIDGLARDVFNRTLELMGSRLLQTSIVPR